MDRKEYYEEHKEEIKQYEKQYYQEHKEERKQWCAQHREERGQYRKQYQSSDHASIYIIENKVNGKVYVGSTCIKPKVRWYTHKGCMKTHPHLPLYSDMLKYGTDNFKFQVLFTAQKEYTKAAEQHVISGFCNIDLYNQVKAKR